MLYHIMSRGVDKRLIFQDDSDRLRFIHNLCILNTEKPLLHNSRALATLGESPSNPLVKIYAYCLMPNHYHIFLEQLVDGTMARFLQKLGSSYVQYFNRKYGRKGVLCETRFKRVEITNEEHFIHLPFYIHCNPLDLFDYGWRAKELSCPEKAWQFLENYSWSSHLDYLGKENFPSVIEKDFLLECFGGTDGYRKGFLQWMKDIQMPKGEIYLEAQ